VTAAETIAEEIRRLPIDKIAPIVQSALDDEAAVPVTVDVEVLDAVSVGPGTVALIRCSGRSGTSTGGKSWSSILKVLEHDAPNQFGNVMESVSTRREVEVYETGLYQRWPGVFRGAKCHFVEHKSDTSTWLWMEDMSAYAGNMWSEKQYILAARGIGEFRGSWFREAIPQYEWLELHPVIRELPGSRMFTSMLAALEQESSTEFIREALPGDLYDQALRLWEWIPEITQAALTLPATVAHNDCHVRNLFASPLDSDNPEIVAIDFGRVGIEHIGADAGDLYGSGFNWTDEEAATLMGILDAFYEAWMDGLKSTGWSEGELETRLGFLVPLLRRTIAVAGMPAFVSADLRGGLPLRRYGGRKEDMPSSFRRRFEFLYPLCEEAIALARQIS